jgi:prevent-host-death family protein
MTVKTLNSEEAGMHLHDVIDAVTTGEAEVVIERHGTPSVVVISYNEYLRVQRKREKRRAKLAKLRARMEADDYMTWEQVEADLKANGRL